MKDWNKDGIAEFCVRNAHLGLYSTIDFMLNMSLISMDT